MRKFQTSAQMREQIEGGVPIGVKSAPKHKVVQEIIPDRKHDESDLHLKFCKWLKQTYPDLHFVRHEKEKARSPYMQNLMQVYNNFDGSPDFELLEVSLSGHFHYYGLYIEFKKPGEQWTLKDGVTCKPQYAHQAQAHKNLWNISRCAYFCNNLEEAQNLVIKYLAGNPEPQQNIIIRENVVTLL